MLSQQLALAASDRLYSWGSSPQVLRLQAQAQKKARVQFHQQQAALAKEVDEPPEPPEPPPKQSSAAPRFAPLNAEMVVSPSNEFKGLLSARSPDQPVNSTSVVSVLHLFNHYKTHTSDIKTKNQGIL